MPLFGLDPATFAGDRISGPLSALWFIVFVTPMFLLTPDVAPRRPIREAVRVGLATLRTTLKQLPQEKSLLRFFLANMIYADGLVALFAFGGIYAAGTFGWATMQIGIFGILLTITGTFGALAGGWLDDRFGPKPVIVGSLLILIFSALRDPARSAATAFSSSSPSRRRSRAADCSPAPAEQVYVALGLLLGIAAGPLQAASRSLLVRLAPRERITQYFGLLALTGKVTSFMGPLAVGIVTAVTASQKAGMAVLMVFFIAGLALVRGVRVD